MESRRPAILAALCVTVLVATGACAPARIVGPGELRQTFGTIAVTTGGAPVQERFQQPITSSGEGAAVAARGAAREFFGALVDPRLIVAAPLLPFFVTGAAIAGALAAESPEIVTTGAVALSSAVKELDFDTILRDRLRDHLARRGSYDVVFREPAVGEPIGTVLRIGVRSVHLGEALIASRGRSVNPRLHLHVVATMDVLERDGHGAALRLRVSQAVSSTSGRARVFRDWGADDARVFKERVREELDELAGKIADTLLQASDR
jgi:hypothetical protein